MVELGKEGLNLPQGADIPTVTTEEEAPGWLKPLLSVNVSDQKEIDIGIGTLRGEPITDSEGRIWGCDDISFRQPFSDHFHNPNLEIILVKSGRAKMKMGGDIFKEEDTFKMASFKQEVEIGPGSLIIVPPNVPQGIEIIEGPLETRVLMSPPYDPNTNFHISLSS